MPNEARRLTKGAVEVVRTLVLTDVVDSTALTSAWGDEAMAAVWSAHDRMARELMRIWRGREIDRTDGFLLLFEDVGNAVAFAIDYHRGLAALPRPLQARTGIHVGPIWLQANPPEDIALGAKPLEIEGLAKPVAARIMAVAQGRQTLMSEHARKALGETGHKVLSHGHWRLKGASEPVELFEIGGDETPFLPPHDGEKAYRVVQKADIWVPVRDVPNNLPQATTSFLGRENDLEQIASVFDCSRLLTLLGTGGLGKTRLALQTAASQLGEYPDGVWFVDLAPLRDPSLIAEHTAHSLGLHSEPGRNWLETLTAHLKPQRVLVILDNCEHMTSACAELAYTLLRATRHLNILATSREVLNLPGEQVLAVAPLEIASGKTGEHGVATRLFVERVRLRDPAYCPDAAAYGLIERIVTHLEGIPLAIELAAAQLRYKGLKALSASLQDRYKALVGGSRVLEHRQRSLRALMDWSYELLGEIERRFFQRLGVFIGGFDLAAVQQVCGTEPISEQVVPDLLASLTDKSLIQFESGANGGRFHMLETVHEYALERLAASGELTALAGRHCLYFKLFAQKGRDETKTGNRAEAANQLERETGNLRAAIACALAGDADPFIAIKISLSLSPFWVMRGRCAEGRDILSRALILPDVRASDEATAYAIEAQSTLAVTQGDMKDAREGFLAALAIRRKIGPAWGVASCLSALALIGLETGNTKQARTYEIEALHLFSDTEHGRDGVAFSLLHLGQIDLEEGLVDDAKSKINETLQLARQIGYGEVEAEAQLTLGRLALTRKDITEAIDRFEACLLKSQRDSDFRSIAAARRWLGVASLERGDLNAAGKFLSAALTFSRDSEMRTEFIGGLDDMAWLASLRGVPMDALRLQGYLATLRSRLELPEPTTIVGSTRPAKAALALILDAADFDRAWREGEQWSAEDAISCALEIAKPG